MAKKELRKVKSTIFWGKMSNDTKKLICKSSVIFPLKAMSVIAKEIYIAYKYVFWSTN